MLHRDSREIVNTGFHLTTFTTETSCSGLDLGQAQRGPNQYCTPCANGPDSFGERLAGKLLGPNVFGDVMSMHGNG
jgi:hypothetical protein